MTNVPRTQKNTGGLAAYFPIIRSRQEILRDIRTHPSLFLQFQQWNQEEQEAFLDICSGARGIKVVYDGFFKEIFNSEFSPERLESLLSLLLNRKVRIQTVLPNDSVRLGSESSLLYTDIIVELEDGSLSNIEIQRIGYAFPGQRSACYSADHLLRQYKRVRSKKGKHFTYRSIKSVYTIVFFETSPAEFHNFPHSYIHRFHQESDTGLTLELLQEYFFIPLDIFRKNMDNKIIGTELEAWLAFLSFDDPKRISELITCYPDFMTMYQDIYQICLNTEKVMHMYSKELAILDRNTIQYMMDEMQAQLDEKAAQLSQITEELTQKSEELNQKDEQLNQKDKQLNQKDKQLNQKDEQLNQKDEQLNQKDEQLNQKDEQIALLQAQLAALSKK